LVEKHLGKFPWENDIDQKQFWMVNQGWSHIQDYNNHLATPQFRESTGEDPADTTVKVHEGITKY